MTPEQRHEDAVDAVREWRDELRRRYGLPPTARTQARLDAMAAPDVPEPQQVEDVPARNKRLIAERTGWPDGALAACNRIEQAHPAWRAWWAPENIAAGFECPTGFHAQFDGRHRSERITLFAPTPEELVALIEQQGDVEDSVWPLPRRW